MGRKWRAEYLKRTYGCGAYRPYETLTMESAGAVGLSAANADKLEALWPRQGPVLISLAQPRSGSILSGTTMRASRHHSARPPRYMNRKTFVRLSRSPWPWRRPLTGKQVICSLATSAAPGFDRCARPRRTGPSGVRDNNVRCVQLLAHTRRRWRVAGRCPRGRPVVHSRP